MEKAHYRSVIRFLFLDGRTCEEIKVMLHAVCEDHAASMTTIRYWFNEFKRSRTALFDEKRPGRPIEVTTKDMVKKTMISCLQTAGWRSDNVDISTERIQNILHEKLGMRKLSARWVPRLRTVEQKRKRMPTSEHCLDMFKRNLKEFLRRFVTVDETWIHHYTPEMKNSQNSGLHPANVLQRRRNENSLIPGIYLTFSHTHIYSLIEKLHSQIIFCILVVAFEIVPFALNTTIWTIKKIIEWFF